MEIEYIIREGKTEIKGKLIGPANMVLKEFLGWYGFTKQTSLIMNNKGSFFRAWNGIQFLGNYATHSKPDGIGSGSGLEGDSG